ncbi:preprotein translocase subunit SecY [Canibacter sp. lx-72]|uniref:preprotein translocase subunit SecY n=1 Tax=Canibacter zhuwentaonis TaxID=2837491 RepID=UPI001BDD0403|nr:preprotein translocase subunit SecY [Canibacter zhuwentaonis]MBT1018162.1 preprotein translocase subunit SecY [Canibacter zhuwentaonis]MBT1035173.1 preprotein translocase subunit SecY [Canibacter zhuwentaonis]
MFRAISRVFRTPDLRRKILFTLAIMAVFRLGSFVPAPFVNFNNVQACLTSAESASGLYQMINLFSGGALLQLSIFALGIMPYITASIITQLLRVVIPHFESLHQEGQAGQAKLSQYTRYLTIGLAILQATTLLVTARSGLLFGAAQSAACEKIVAPEWWAMLVQIVTMTAGTGLVMWLGELITERGIGNGMSLLIFTSIAAGFPGALMTIQQSKGWEIFIFVILIGLVVMLAVVFVEQSQRRIPVQYAKRVIGRRTYGGSSTYIPIKVNMAGVIPVIFASSILFIPLLITQFNTPAPGKEPAEWVVWIQNNLVYGDQPIYMAVFFLLTIAFAFFYVGITFNPDEVAGNMKRYGGFIPGIRAGQPTADFLRYVINRITSAGALYLGFIAMIPLFALALFSANQNFPFGGSSILIIVGVGLETVKQIDAQLQERHYEGLIKN